MYVTPFQLLGERELSELVQGVYFTVLDKICTEHFHIALDMGQNGTYNEIYTVHSSYFDDVRSICAVCVLIKCHVYSLLQLTLNSLQWVTSV